MGEKDFEKEILIKEIVALQPHYVNPDFEEQLRELLDKYVVFSKNRCPERV